LAGMLRCNLRIALYLVGLEEDVEALRLELIDLKAIIKT